MKSSIFSSSLTLGFGLITSFQSNKPALLCALPVNPEVRAYLSLAVQFSGFSLFLRSQELCPAPGRQNISYHTFLVLSIAIFKQSIQLGAFLVIYVI